MIEGEIFLRFQIKNEESKIIFFILCVLLFSSYLKGIARTEDITKNVSEVTLFSNGYAYPKTGDDVLWHINANGLTKWNDKAIFTRTFFSKTNR